jgi:predicted DNA-binding protein with PD1-like motif
MRYTTARMGRIFVARVDHGEDLLGELQAILRREGIERGFMLFLGALSQGSLVTGPEEAVIPPIPHMVGFGGGWEVVGIATVFPGEEGPAIHIHAALGRGDEALTGCLRVRAETYLVVEVVIIELLDLPVKRNRDERTGVLLPGFDAEPR